MLAEWVPLKVSRSARHWRTLTHTRCHAPSARLIGSGRGRVNRPRRCARGSVGTPRGSSRHRSRCSGPGMRRRSDSGTTRTPTGLPSRTWTASTMRRRCPGTPTSTRRCSLRPSGRSAVLPWPAFGILWSLLQAGLFAWLLRPLPVRWFAPALVATVPEILTGNIYALMASALVLGATRGSPWVFLGLTKVTPGLVGVAWLAASRRWRALAGGVLVGGVLVGMSYLAAPTAWQDWVHFLASGSDSSAGRPGLPWLTVTLVAFGLAVTVFAAVTRRGWLLPVATILVSPTFGPNTLTLLSAVPRLTRRQREDRAARQAVRSRRSCPDSANRARAAGRRLWPTRVGTSAALAPVRSRNAVHPGLAPRASRYAST